MENLLLEIIERGLINTPALLRAMSCRFQAEATLLDDGCIELDDQVFATVDAAMVAAIGRQGPVLSGSVHTGNPWKFWGFYCHSRGAWAPIEHLQAQLMSLKGNREIRTSETHPLRIDRLSIPGADGVLGLTFCPGKKTESIYGGDWSRSLEKDLSCIDSWGASLLVTLLENQEFYVLGVPDFVEKVKGFSFEWIHLPIKDMSIPGKEFESLWLSVGPEVHARLDAGERVVIHCRGGIGRTGMLAAQILVERGMHPLAAIENVRIVREHSIETFAQEEYVINKLWSRQ